MNNDELNTIVDDIGFNTVTVYYLDRTLEDGRESFNNVCFFSNYVNYSLLTEEIISLFEQLQDSIDKFTAHYFGLCRDISDVKRKIVELFPEDAELFDKLDQISGENYEMSDEHYYDDDPYTVYFENNHLFVDFSDPENIKYKRWDSETQTLKDISIFDDENVESKQYGADQMDFSWDFENLINDENIMVRLESVYPGESLEFYERYCNVICETGCGYAAAANSIFKRYEGREADFEKTFGYPMYTVSDVGEIDFNYEYFMLDYFNYDYAGKGITLEQMEKGVNLSNNIQDFFTPDAISTACSFETLDDFLKDKYDVVIENRDDWHNRFSFGSDGKVERQISNLMDEWDVCIFGGNGWDLYNEDGKLCYNDGGSHYMYVTEFNEFGRPIISSWGEKYVLDMDGSGMYRYTTINFD